MAGVGFDRSSSPASVKLFEMGIVVVVPALTVGGARCDPNCAFSILDVSVAKYDVGAVIVPKRRPKIKFA